MPSITKPLSFSCFYCKIAYWYTLGGLQTKIPHDDSLNFMKDHMVKDHNLSPNITLPEMKYILDLMVKYELSTRKNSDPFTSLFPYKLRDSDFYCKQLKKIFIHFACENLAQNEIPNESEYVLYPRVLDKVILDGRDPPSQILNSDEFFYDFENYLHFWDMQN